jgi:hypothetical protein
MAQIIFTRIQYKIDRVCIINSLAKMKLSNFDSPKHFMSHPEDHQIWQGGKLLRIASKVIRVHLETRDQRPISRMLLKISMVMAETTIMGMVVASQHRQVRDAFR